MKTSSVLKPTMLFAAGAIASTAASAAPTIEDVDYTASVTPFGTQITIGNSSTAQYGFKTNLSLDTYEYTLDGQDGSQVTTTSQAAAFYPTATNPALSGRAVTGGGMKGTDAAALAVASNDRYFGLRFKINDDQYTGWAKVNAVGDNISQIGYQLAGGAGVPEPSSWALMIAGFGGVGLAMRRRRRQVAVAAVA